MAIILTSAVLLVLVGTILLIKKLKNKSIPQIPPTPSPIPESPKIKECYTVIITNNGELSVGGTYNKCLGDITKNWSVSPGKSIKLITNGDEIMIDNQEYFNEYCVTTLE